VGVSTGFGVPRICEAEDGERTGAPTIQRGRGTFPPLGGARTPRSGIREPWVTERAALAARGNVLRSPYSPPRRAAQSGVLCCWARWQRPSAQRLAGERA